MAFTDALFQAAVAVVELRVRKDPGGAALRVPVIAPWTFLLLELGLAIGCLVRTPRETAYGLVAMVVGSIVYRLWRRTA